MAALTLSNHVLYGAQGATWDEWVCIERIVWTGITTKTHLLEINDKNGKSVLEPVRAGTVDLDREINMHGKWANGLNIVDLDSGTVNIYLRQT